MFVSKYTLIQTLKSDPTEHDMQDFRVKAAFGAETALVVGHSEAGDPEIHNLWRHRLRDAGRRRPSKTSRGVTGWVGHTLVRCHLNG